MAKFYGIGVGPGDGELLTLKAVRVLNLLDVLLIPSTKKEKSGVAENIIKDYLKEGIEHIYIDFPMVSDENVFIEAGTRAAKIITQLVKEGKNVGFVTLGDASIYSTYGYIVKALLKEVEIETIPGIPSFCAAAALANRSLVEKDEILAIIPMNAKDEQIDKVLSVSDAFAFMKIYKREERLLTHLKKHTLEQEGVLAQRCGFQNAKVHEQLEQSLMSNEDYLTLVLCRKNSI